MCVTDRELISFGYVYGEKTVIVQKIQSFMIEGLIRTQSIVNGGICVGNGRPSRSKLFFIIMDWTLRGNTLNLGIALQLIFEIFCRPVAVVPREIKIVVVNLAI